MARILHVLASPRAEGTPRLVLDWLAVPGHEQRVVFLTGLPGELLDDFRRGGWVLSVEDSVVSGVRKYLRIIDAARRAVKRFSPDIVIAWPMGFSHWVFLGARLAGSRAALLSHGGNPPGQGWFKRYVQTWICLWTTALCRGRVVACSRYVQGLFRAIALVPSSIVGFAYNSVQTSRVANRSDAARRNRGVGHRFRATMVATLESHKDHPTFLRAAKILRDRQVELEIALVGGGSRETELKAMAVELGIEEIVTFFGARRDVPELLGQSDVFVLATTPQEGRPGVILEALAAGLPIIASDVEPLREVLENGRWGKLVPVGNADALAESLVEAIRSTPDQGSVAAGRAYAARFTPESMVADYLREVGFGPAKLDEPLGPVAQNELSFK